MKIETAWIDDGEGPWMVTSYDEYTQDAHGGGIPDFAQKEIEELPERARGDIRWLTVEVPDSVIDRLFAAVKYTVHDDVRPIESEK